MRKYSCRRTSPIFDNVKAARDAATEYPTILEISVDTKTKWILIPFGRQIQVQNNPRWDRLAKRMVVIIHKCEN